MQQLFVATTNTGKQKEITALLSESGVSLVFPQDLPKTADIEVDETGTTFAENAFLKATEFAAVTDMPTLADDSGLIVTALGNFPGVHSNRWFAGTDAERNQALLQKMANLDDRRAEFVTVLCLFDPVTKHTTYITGKVAGVIATESRGEGGFGYDPVFIPDGHEQSFSELGESVKNQLSHRARALMQLREHLSSR